MKCTRTERVQTDDFRQHISIHLEWNKIDYRKLICLKVLTS